MQQIGVLETLGYRSKEISFGVAGYGKGGDVNHNHAYLLVAPGEQISVSVLSNGGSSTLNALVAEAIMDVCLEEKGIHFQEEEKVSHEILLEIPDSYDSLAGIYVARNDLAGGDGIKRIAFPEHKYMHVESISAINISYEDYVLTTDGRFAELAAEVEDSGMEEMRIAMNPDLLTFVTTKSGKTLIACEGKKNIAGIGSYEEMTYVGEKLAENKVSDSTISSWNAACGQEFFLVNDVWASQGYDVARLELAMAKEAPGYVYMINGMGIRLLKLVDENKAVSELSVPSSTSRDLLDVTLVREGAGLKLQTSAGYLFMAENDMEYFDDGIKEIDLTTGEAKWFRVSDSMVNREVTLAERPKNSAVYVYNKYGEVIYTTHIVDETIHLPMPEGGKLVFLGETGDTVRLK